MQRDKVGAFQTLYEELKNDEKNILITFECRYQHSNNYCNDCITVYSDRIRK
jgi:hypothetical protein